MFLLLLRYEIKWVMHSLVHYRLINPQIFCSIFNFVINLARQV